MKLVIKEALIFLLSKEKAKAQSVDLRLVYL